MNTVDFSGSSYVFRSVDNAIKGEQTQKEIVSPANTTDQVTISTAGRNASIATMPAGMPSWSSDFSHHSRMVSFSELTAESNGYNGMHERFISDGNITNKEKQALNSYKQNSMSATNYTRDNSQFEIEHRKELEEFREILANERWDTFEEYGVLTPEDYNEKVLNMPGDNQDIRLSIQEKILSNPRAMQLMGVLNIKQLN